MSRILFLPLALAPAAGAAAGSPPGKLAIVARQIPRLLAEQLNGQAPELCRFLPLVGNEPGRRGFLTFSEPFPHERLDQLLGSELRPELLVDGVLSERRVSLRVTRCAAGAEPNGHPDCRIRVPFDPEDVQTALLWLVQEISDALELEQRPAPPPRLPGEAFDLYLLGRDEELALAANLVRHGTASPFAPLLESLLLAPAAPALQRSILTVASLYIEQGRGDPDEAAEALARAAEIGDCSDEFLEKAAHLARFSKNREATKSLIARHLERAPGDAVLAFSLASERLSREQTEEASRILESCLRARDEPGQREQSTIPVLTLLLQIAMQRRQGAKAESWARMLLARESLPADSLLVLVSWLGEQGRHRDALDRLEPAIAREPENKELLLEKGRNLMFLGLAREAGLELERAKEEGNRSIREAAEHLLRYVEHPQLLGLMEEGERALNAKEPKKALALARRASELDPGLAEAWFLLGLVRCSMNQNRRAVKALRRALELRPELSEARNRLGILLVSLGRHQEGHDELALVLRERDEQLGPLLHMAQACHYLKRQGEGLEHLERAERLFPDHPAVVETRRSFFAGD
ncbi:MAG: tetratricopeptide repeat protein [Planctomycetota bacterium]